MFNIGAFVSSDCPSAAEMKAARPEILTCSKQDDCSDACRFGDMITMQARLPPNITLGGQFVWKFDDANFIYQDLGDVISPQRCISQTLCKLSFPLTTSTVSVSFYDGDDFTYVWLAFSLLYLDQRLYSPYIKFCIKSKRCQLERRTVKQSFISLLIDAIMSIRLILQRLVID